MNFEFFIGNLVRFTSLSGELSTVLVEVETAKWNEMSPCFCGIC